MIASARLLACAALSCVVLPASAVVIDNFEDGDFQLNIRGEASTASPESISVTGAAGNIIGGVRQANLRLRDGRGIVDASLVGADVGIGDVDDGTGTGQFFLSDSDLAFTNFALTYDNLGGVDLTDGGADNSVVLNFESMQGVSRIFVDVRDGSGGRDTVARRAYAFESPSAPVDLATTQQLFFEFAAFDGVDFTDIQKITVGFDSISFDSRGGTDLVLNEIVTAVVPEPAGLAVAAAGALLLAGRRRAA